MPAYGTMLLSDLLAQTSGTVATIGEQNVWETFQRSLDAHNRQMTQMVDLFCGFTTERLIGTGGLTAGDFEELDELETPRPQKHAPGENMGIPMRNYGYGQQWTDLYLEESTPADLAGQFIAVMDADKRNIINQINRAFYLSANYTSIDTRKKDFASLPVKRLANADSFSIPVGPNGETFDSSTHTHYVARVSTFATTDLDALILNAGEHYTGMVKVFINSAQEVAVRALTGFVATVDVRIQQTTSTAYVNTPGLDMTNRGDRFIGVYNGAVLHESTRIPAVSIAAGAGVGRRAVFCGAQAAVFGTGQKDDATGNEMSWFEELFDYGNKLGVSAGLIGGLKKNQFNSLDFATIAISTYSPSL